MRWWGDVVGWRWGGEDASLVGWQGGDGVVTLDDAIRRLVGGRQLAEGEVLEMKVITAEGQPEDIQMEVRKMEHGDTNPLLEMLQGALQQAEQKKEDGEFTVHESEEDSA